MQSDGGGQGSQRSTARIQSSCRFACVLPRLTNTPRLSGPLKPLQVLVSPSSVDVGPVAAHHLHVSASRKTNGLGFLSSSVAAKVRRGKVRQPCEGATCAITHAHIYTPDSPRFLFSTPARVPLWCAKYCAYGFGIVLHKTFVHSPVRLHVSMKLVSQCLDWVLVPLLMQKSRKQRSHLLTLCFFLHHLHQIQRRDGRRATLSPAQLFGGRGKALGWEGPRQFQGESQGLAHAEGVDNPPRRM
ncbi:hypothetical protein HOP50_20g85910 [Chloropicon primus]|nr:hypothetical protein HOP50_20g85910 [Chloropicon primus]